MFLRPKDKILIASTGFLLLLTCMTTLVFYVFNGDADLENSEVSMVARDSLDDREYASNNHLNNSLTSPDSESENSNLESSQSLRSSKRDQSFNDQNNTGQDGNTLDQNALEQSDQSLISSNSSDTTNSSEEIKNRKNQSLKDPNAALGFFDLERLAGLKSPSKSNAVKVVEKEEREIIPFKTIYEDSSELAEGESKIVASGANGERVVLKRLVYDAEGLISEEILSSRVSKPKYDRLVLRGSAALNAESPKQNPPENQNSVPETAMAVANESAKQGNEETVEQSSETASNEAEALQADTSQAEAGDSAEVAVAAQAANQANNPANLAFTGSGAADEMVVYNLNLLKNAGVFTPAGTVNYTDFSDQGNGQIVVNGISFSYFSVAVHFTTCYDGVECSIAMGMDPPINNNTATGVPAQRGLCASNEFPFGTVLFVEGYGFCVVSDRHGTPSHPDLVDLCYDGGESTNSGFETGRRNVYVIFMP